MSRNYDAFIHHGDYQPQDELDDLMDFISDSVAEMPVLGDHTDIAPDNPTISINPNDDSNELRTEKKDD